MGRRAVVELDPNVEPAKPPEEAGGETAASLFDASGDARVRVMRRDNTSQKMVTHGYFPPTVTEEDVSNAFGGGHYRAQLVIPDPASGLAKVKTSREFYIPGAYRPPSKINTFEEAGPNGASGTVAAASAATQQVMGVTGGDDLMQVLKAGIINTLLEMMKSTKEMQRPVQTGPDPMMLKLMETQSQLQMKILELIMTRDNGKDDPRKEIMAELLQMKELFGGAGGAVPADPMKMFSNMLDTFKSFREAAEDVAPQSNVDPIMGSIPKLVEVVAEQHQMQKDRAAHVTHVPTPAPHGGVARMPVVGTLPQGQPMELWRQTLRQQATRLLASAAAKRDPDAIAGTAIVFAPPHILEALKVFFHRPEDEATSDILVEIPQMAEHREWLVEFVECMQDRLFPGEFSEEAEEVVEDIKDTGDDTSAAL